MLRKIIFDMDDTLWGLDEKAAKMADIDYNKLVTYVSEENPLLTTAEKQRLISAYNSKELFKNIQWFDGIERINTLKADVHIKSNIFLQEIDQIKRTQLNNVLQIPNENIHLDLVTDPKQKHIDPDTFIFVDDSPHNIIRSNAKHNIMLKHPWNTSSYGTAIIGSKPVIMIDSLNDIIDVIETLLTRKE